MPNTTEYDLSGCDCCVINTDCCSGVPTTLTATIADLSCGSAYDGQTVTLTYDSGQVAWIGTKTIDGKLFGLGFSCVSSSATWRIFSPPGLGLECMPVETAESSSACDPVYVIFDIVPVDGTGCCSGIGTNIKVTVTE